MINEGEILEGQITAFEILEKAKMEEAGNNMQEDKRICSILNFYGEENQKIKAIEELGELITGLAKWDLENIQEEIGDVEIMLSQLKLFKGIDIEKINEYKEFKLNRQIKRIEG